MSDAQPPTEGRVALVRGINVGGNRQIPMADLRALCTGLGFEAVATYIQSGNVTFRTAATAPDRSGDVEAAIAARFGWPIRVTERSHTALAEIVDADPFPAADPKTRLVMFLFEPLAPAATSAYAHVVAGDDEARVVGREIHLHCPNGYGRTTLTKILTERHLGVVATTRNWRTVATLRAMTA